KNQTKQPPTPTGTDSRINTTFPSRAKPQPKNKPTHKALAQQKQPTHNRQAKKRHKQNVNTLLSSQRTHTHGQAVMTWGS
ncbi:hypothetical protein, partial [Williamsia sp. CHRR-6]|uniref:hypothetical protein n=1 Tax=Williamsia sp. CHRR-6 TaxID=2835871 RepID=UPI001BD93F5F